MFSIPEHTDTLSREVFLRELVFIKIPVLVDSMVNEEVSPENVECQIYFLILCMHSIFPIFDALLKRKSLKPEDTIDFHIKRTWQSIARMYNEEAGKYDATMATGYVLLNIDIEHGTPSTALGPKMGMEANSLSRILKNMEDRGLIERRRNPVDGRSVLVHLTKFGQEKRLDAREAVVQFNNIISSEIPEQKLEIFFEVISQINELITNRKIYQQKV